MSDIVKSNKRWFAGVAMLTALAGLLLLYVGVIYTLPQAYILCIISVFTSGLFTGTYLMYRAENP